MYFKTYAREKERMKFMLQSAPGRICFTSDLWTSIVTDRGEHRAVWAV